MKIKKRLMVSIAIIVAAAVISGVTYIAASNYGSQTDPLVTLSYMTDKYKPAILDELKNDLNTSIEALKTEFDAKLQEHKASLDSADYTDRETNFADTFSVVTLTADKTLTCAVGTEMILRIGTAVGFGTIVPALVDITAGAVINDGDPLIANHAYVVTIESHGIKATADIVRVLVRGAYSIG